MIMSKNCFFGAVKGVLFFTFLSFVGTLYAQTDFSNQDTPYLSVDLGAGTSDVLVEGMSFGLLFTPKLSITPQIMIGSKNIVHFSTDEIIALETQGFFRWNFLRLGKQRPSGNTTDIFIQGGVGFLGAFKGSEIKDSRASLLADATAGITIPLSSRWHIEPSVRAGYPFIGGAAITAGYKFPLSSKTAQEQRPPRTQTEYVEIIKTLPPNEIIKRIIISQIEYIIFAPNIARFNSGIDSDARALNELVIDHIARILRENPALRVRIEGHANPVTNAPGESEELYELSAARAGEVARQLRAKGVSQEQLVVAAHGGTRVVASASDHDHWNMNRRVELIIIQLDTN